MIYLHFELLHKFFSNSYKVQLSLIKETNISYMYIYIIYKRVFPNNKSPAATTTREFQAGFK